MTSNSPARIVAVSANLTLCCLAKPKVSFMSKDVFCALFLWTLCATCLYSNYEGYLRLIMAKDFPLWRTKTLIRLPNQNKTALCYLLYREFLCCLHYLDFQTIWRIRRCEEKWAFFCDFVSPFPTPPPHQVGIECIKHLLNISQSTSIKVGFRLIRGKPKGGWD